MKLSERGGGWQAWEVHGFRLRGDISPTQPLGCRATIEDFESPVPISYATLEIAATGIGDLVLPLADLSLECPVRTEDFARQPTALWMSAHLEAARDDAPACAMKRRLFPEILEALEDGRLHLSAVVLLSPHLTTATVTELIAAATHKNKTEIE